MKRFISVCLALIFAVAVTLQVDARETMIVDAESELQINEQYVLEFESKVDAQARIVNTFKGESVKDRILKASSITNVSDKDIYSATQELLRNMGMGESFIEALSQDDLKMYSESDYIVSTITESVHPNTRSNDSSASNENVTLTLFVSHVGGNYYKFSVDVDWFTVPGVRGEDLVGISATSGSPQSSTFEGWYTYTDKKGANKYVEFTDDLFSIANYGAWSAACVSYDLEDDVRTNLDIHFEYTWLAENTPHTYYFDVAGSYDHMTSIFGSILYDITPTLKNRNSMYVIEMQNDNNAELLTSIVRNIYHIGS